MQFKLLSLSAIAALAATAAADASCSASYGGSFEYTVTASGVADIPGICGGLWDNLKRFSLYCVVMPGPSCGADDNGDLKWNFITTNNCDEGCIESAWWHATKNQFGALTCPSSTTKLRMRGSKGASERR